ncbi:hypothetical protein K470DRAFT_30831 [Piedraia hortae CBS 480.64]|uniref:Lytic polysaccharide monooxygenase n=1 Tax=Piedraia hortae CBS 480.64 TaxID=1314780 RepID=A0A6A7C2V8_9PEZI|nr:hypothetical protein K470DRAFT_30831 [Piedraia hortae CBS 480.64]
MGLLNQAITTLSLSILAVSALPVNNGIKFCLGDDIVCKGTTQFGAYHNSFTIKLLLAVAAVSTATETVTVGTPSASFVQTTFFSYQPQMQSPSAYPTSAVPTSASNGFPMITPPAFLEFFCTASTSSPSTSRTYLGSFQSNTE